MCVVVLLLQRDRSSGPGVVVSVWALEREIEIAIFYLQALIYEEHAGLFSSSRGYCACVVLPNDLDGNGVEGASLFLCD